MSKYTSFEDLEIYNAAIEFIVKVFELLKREEFEIEWAFTDQLKKCNPFNIE